MLAAEGAYFRLYMSQFRGEDAEEQFTAEVLAETEPEAGAPVDETAASDGDNTDGSNAEGESTEAPAEEGPSSQV